MFHQLLYGHRGGDVGQKIGRLLSLREGDDIPRRFGMAHGYHKAIRLLAKHLPVMARKHIPRFGLACRLRLLPIFRNRRPRCMGSLNLATRPDRR